MSDELDPVIPPGMASGCLLRASAVGELCPLAGERIPLVPRGEWAERAKAFNDGAGMRPFVPEVLSQNPAGSCATESTTQSVMTMRRFRGLEHVLLNPWFIYYHTGGQYDRGDGRSGGSSIDTNLAFVREKGIAPMSVWPRSKGWKTKPSDEAYAAAEAFKIVEFYDVQNLDECVSCLLHGFPVVYGAAGHSVLKIAYDLDVNSWGEGWKDGGFGTWVTASRIDYRYGCFAVRVTEEQ